VFFIVIVIVPVWATAALAGVILNSLSLSVTEPPDAAGVEAGVDAALLELELLLEEPQPASSAAMAIGAPSASGANSELRVRVMFILLEVCSDRRTLGGNRSRVTGYAESND
jgi:hypothetical protein